jgi:ABC-type antimicrobial peptide transport system permease subunit
MNVGEERMFANLSSAMGGLTLLLAAVGLYGIMSYSVRRRTAEIGVRMALGAQQGDVLGMVLRESLVLVGLGLVAGIPIALAGARAASKVLQDVLFGIKPTDPMSFALAIGTMIAVAAFAAFFPARRAARTDPMEALRCE